MVHGCILLVQVSKRGQRGLRLLPAAVPPDPHIPCKNERYPQDNIAGGCGFCIFSVLAARVLTSQKCGNSTGQASCASC